MKMQCACVTAFEQPLELAEIDRPEPTGREVLVRVRAAGVCHSDLHFIEGGYDLGAGRRISLKDRGVKLPAILGHEIAGEVVAVGPLATGYVLGKSYLVHPWIGCGECDCCQRGNENGCAAAQYLGVQRHGGFAQYVLVPDARYLIDIGNRSPAEMAPFACSGVTAYSALKKVGPTLVRRPIVVFGAGGLGLMCLSVMKAMGAKGAIVVDIDPAKREAALAAGALAVIDGNAPDALAQIVQAAGGQVDAAVDFVGSPSSAQLGFDCLAKLGKLVIVGLFGGSAPWSVSLFPMRGISVIGSLVGNLEDMQELMHLVRAGKVAPIPVTSYRLDQVGEAVEQLKKGQVVGRAVLIP